MLVLTLIKEMVEMAEAYERDPFFLIIDGDD